MFGFLKKIKHALFGKPVDENTLKSLEKLLYEADLGSACTKSFIDYLRLFFKKHPEASFEQIREALKAHALSILNKMPITTPQTSRPLVFLIIGINGSGKTTSIAKLAKRFQDEGKSVLLAAADTFRAAAIEQLSTWAERLKIDIVKSKPGSDPSSVAFDALTAAKARGTDIVLIDTAGRLQNKTDLMRELEKIKRTCNKVIPGAPHETLLVLDATVGQNALDQAKIFHQFAPLTGILLAKLDGSAKGGVILSIYEELAVPIRFIGIGEKINDLVPFDANEYLSKLFDM